MAVLEVALPRRDNLHLVWGNVIVHPAHRRQGHGTALVAEIVRRATEAGRTTIWLGTAEDDLGSRAFLEARASTTPATTPAASRSSRRSTPPRWTPARQAVEAAADYVIERLEPPYTDELLEQLVEVTAAINDAPMGDLTFEDEVFDVARLRDIESAREGRGDRIYRLAARHRETGVIGGHTVVVVNPLRPEHAGQGDTAVHRDHRGHRLGSAAQDRDDAFAGRDGATAHRDHHLEQRRQPLHDRRQRGDRLSAVAGVRHVRADGVVGQPLT